MDSLHRHDCLASLWASTHSIQGWDTSLACICSPDNGPKRDETHVDITPGIILPRWNADCINWHTPQSAVAALAKDSHIRNVNTAL